MIAMDMKLSPEQIKLRSAARELAETEFAPKAAEVDRTEAYPFDNVAALKAAGFMGYTIPTSYGGRGGSYFEAALIIEEMARVCGATGRITVEANMGAISAVMQYGTEKQKRMGADLVLSGDKPAICITEPEAGSAATEMTCGQARQHVCHPRQEALDHGRRGFQTPPDLRPGIR